jgi:hypothetical protein
MPPRHMFKKRGNKIYEWYGTAMSRENAKARVEKELSHKNNEDHVLILKNHNFGRYEYDIWVR